MQIVEYFAISFLSSKSEQGIKRESGPVLTPLWVEGRAALVWGWKNRLLGQIDRDGQFVELGLLDDAGSIQHHVTSAVVLGEGYTVADAVEAGEEAHEAVETVGQTSVWGCTVLEGIHQEAELALRLLGGEAQNLEYLLLKLGIVDTDAASTYLHAVDDHIVGIGTHAGGVGIEQGDILGLGRGERMVHGHEALLLVAPLVHGEVYHPQA